MAGGGAGGRRALRRPWGAVHDRRRLAGARQERTREGPARAAGDGRGDAPGGLATDRAPAEPAARLRLFREPRAPAPRLGSLVDVGTGPGRAGHLVGGSAARSASGAAARGPRARYPRSAPCSYHLAGGASACLGRAPPPRQPVLLDGGASMDPRRIAAGRLDPAVQQSPRGLSRRWCAEYLPRCLWVATAPPVWPRPAARRDRPAPAGPGEPARRRGAARSGD